MAVVVTARIAYNIAELPQKCDGKKYTRRAGAHKHNPGASIRTMMVRSIFIICEIRSTATTLYAVLWPCRSSPPRQACAQATNKRSPNTKSHVSQTVQHTTRSVARVIKNDSYYKIHCVPRVFMCRSGRRCANNFRAYFLCERC